MAEKANIELCPETLISNLARFAVERCPDAVFWFREDGRVLYVNEQACLSLDYAPDELLTKTVPDFSPKLLKASPDGTWEQLWGRLKAEKIVLLEMPQERRDGTLFPVELRFDYVALDGGDYGCASARDITTRKNLESDSEVQQLQLIKADRMASLGALVAGAAQEIENPNNLLRSSLNVLRQVMSEVDPILEQHYKDKSNATLAGLPYREVREAMPKLLDDMTRESERIAELVGGLKEVAGTSSGTPDQVTEVNAAVQAAVSLVSSTISKSTRRMELDLSDDLPDAPGDLQRLEQVLVNVLLNACQALPSMNCAIGVKTCFESETNRLSIAIRDEGVGISKKNLERICDPFYTTKRGHGGTGLGLSVSARIIADLGGTMSFDSTEGEGTTVTIRIPAG